MKRSTERILTKPVGSFHRPPTLENMMMAERKGEPVDPQELATEIQKAAADIVAMQIACGMDYVSDGEVSKISFMEYPYQRLSGFTGGLTGWVPPDILDFEDTRDFWYQSAAPYVELRQNDGPIQLVHPDLVQVDLANFRQALGAHQNIEGFLCAASPGVVGLVGTTFYQDEPTFFHAIADAMISEYRAILDAGYMLQLDIPDVTMIGAYLLQDRDLYRQSVQPRIEVLKYVLSNLPAEKIVLHACWGNWPGPHHRDTPLDWMIDLLLDLPAQGLSIEAMTATHQHDWHVFEKPQIAERFRSGEKILFVGLIDTKARALEPAEVIAERLCQYAELVGKENVVASTDCGFGTFLGRNVIPSSLVEAKLKRLTTGAQLASQRLWK